MTDFLVSTDWLERHLEAPDVAVIDASWHLPTEQRDPHAEYLETRISGALFFDIDDICDTKSDLPHMLPAPEKFASRMRKMGMGDGKRIVVYDSTGLFSAARAWWMFRVFGHEDVVVLDGGLKKWLAEGRPVRSGPPRPRQERHFTCRFHTMMVCDQDDVLRVLDNKDSQIADARGPARFSGAEQEPRAGLRSGHMPGAINVHYRSLLNEDGTVKSRKDLRAVFDMAGINLKKPVITSCGSGVTAAIVSLGLAIAGHDDVTLYDGSWAQWGANANLPIATGT